MKYQTNPKPIVNVGWSMEIKGDERRSSIRPRKGEYCIIFQHVYNRISESQLILTHSCQSHILVHLLGSFPTRCPSWRPKVQGGYDQNRRNCTERSRLRFQEIGRPGLWRWIWRTRRPWGSLCNYLRCTLTLLEWPSNMERKEACLCTSSSIHLRIPMCFLCFLFFLSHTINLHPRMTLDSNECVGCDRRIGVSFKG